MKKIIAIMLVMLLAFSVVGCKSKGYIDDEEIAVAAGDETQVDIQENTGANKQEQKTEEKAETPKETVDASDKTTDESTENTDKVTDTSTESTDADDSTTQAEQSTDSVLESKTETNDINQLEYDNREIRICQGKVMSAFSFDNVANMINTLKTHEYTVSEEERKDLEECFSAYSDKQLSTDSISKIGTKDDVRYDEFKTDKIKYFYKIKDIPGYNLTNIYLTEKEIEFIYAPIGEEKITVGEDTINVKYMRNEHFVTDSYFEDYLEYYKNTTVTKDGFIYKDYYEKHGFATIIFPVENTIIEIFSSSDTANYEALKKLCVAEKVVVK